MAGIDLLQGYPEDSFIQDLAFLPQRDNFSAAIIITAGDQRKVLEFPIAVRYKPLIAKLGRKYTLDDTKPENETAISQPLQLASTEEVQELLQALWNGVRTYKEGKDIPVARLYRETASVAHGRCSRAAFYGDKRDWLIAVRAKAKV